MPSENSRRSRAVFVWAGAGIVLAAISVWVALISRPPASESLVWMSPAKLAQTLQPGRLTLLKYRVMRWPGPWRWLTRNKQQVLIEAQLLGVTEDALGQMQVSAQCRTNADGNRAWILSPEELADFRKRLKKLPGAEVENAMRLTTYVGGQAVISSGNTGVGGSSAFVGFVMNVLPKVSGGSFKLLVGATATEAIPAQLGAAGGVRTNVSVACKVVVPNGGALVVDGGKRAGGASTSQWLIVAPVAVDAKGNLVKLGR